MGTFIGADGSCGFRKNKEYIIDIKYQYGKYWLFGCKKDTKEKHACPYDTLEGVLRNWDLRVVFKGGIK